MKSRESKLWKRYSFPPFFFPLFCPLRQVLKAVMNYRTPNYVDFRTINSGLIVTDLGSCSVFSINSFMMSMVLSMIWGRR